MAWIRLDTDFDRVPWLRKLPRAVRHAWVDLLRHTKVESPKKGIVKYRDAEDLAYAMRYEDDETETIRALVEAGTQPGPGGEEPALRIVGKTLVVVNWHAYQSTEAERSRRFRAVDGVSNSDETPGNAHTVSNEDDTGEASTPVSNLVCNTVLSCATLDRENTVPTELVAEPPGVKIPDAGIPVTGQTVAENDGWDPVARVLYQVHERLRWPAPVDADIRKMIREGGAIPTMIDERGEDGAIEMFLHAHRNWSGDKRPTWAAVAGQRNQIWEAMHPASILTVEQGGVPPKTPEETLAAAEARRRLLVQ